MALQVELLSTETIKPSSPTLQNLKKHTLSFLDQIAPEVFVPLIYYYSASDQINHKSDHLKKSLSEALTRFYPLAGRRTNNHYVDCNDKGVHYVETSVNSNLYDIIRDPVPNELNKLLPFELDHVTDLNFAVQVNFFKCGGIAIGVVISHKVADALSFLNFINTWSAIARGDHNMPSPLFNSAKLFPPIDVSGFEGQRAGIIKENIVCKRFVFSESKILALREKNVEGHINHTDTANSKLPTRVEALSTFIWNRFMAATQNKSNGDNEKKIYTIIYAVNLRSRFDPPLPESQFGNLFRIATFVPPMGNELEKQENDNEMIKKAREAIRFIDTKYVEKLKGGEYDHLMDLKDMIRNFTKGELVSFSFTSLSRFNLYDANFGWGEPLWIGSAKLTYNNLVTFFNNKEGDGIEAWINLKDDEMTKFEADMELKSFVSATTL